MKAKSPVLSFFSAKSVEPHSPQIAREQSANKKRQLALVIIVSLLILLWSYTTANKLIDIHQFRRQLFNQSFSQGTAVFLLWLIPISEILTTLLLLLQKTRLMGLILSWTLMLLFTGYITLVLLGYYQRIPCSCGGVIKALSWHQHLYFNLFFLAISLIGIYLQLRTLKRPTTKSYT